MPIYEYLCPSNHKFEIRLEITSDPAQQEICPTCGLSAVRVPSRLGYINITF